MSTLGHKVLSTVSQQEATHLDAEVVRGYGVASGQAEDSPYPAGSIPMQAPFFHQLGLDIESFFPGTLNLSIAPHHWELIEASRTFRQVAWNPEGPPEDFSFAPCQILRRGGRKKALVYYPHPETKPAHQHDSSVMELLAPPLPGISYGEKLTLVLPKRHVKVL